jgi:2-C-methyl-D-erythritol 4-phosphate cytidylyltransferase
VIVHDAVRPCIDRESMSRLRTELTGDPVGEMLAIPFEDTLKRADVATRVLRTESGAGLWKAQTHQDYLSRGSATPAAILWAGHSGDHSTA